MNILFNLYVILALRILHVAGGVLWVGAATFYLFLLIPAVRASESSGQKLMQNLGPRMGPFMGIVTTTTVLSGALLYARFFAGGISFIWTTGAGFAFLVGAVAAIGSYVMGVTIFGKTQEKIGALGAAMAGAGAPPQPEQVAEMRRLQAFLMKAYQVDFVLLVVAMLAMAVARYL
ncbi:MAG: hypothetical protein DCC56_00035 [Anaerolineae bacterium]|nr:MAG: hypothetical protein DCC56_00035 [Anaerolineae bacterium]WKZ44417.1 MAG: hypothetical protein QY302_01340 [Anaerolineales bacterium]